MAGVSDVKSSDEFRQIVQNASGSLVVVHFWADWAPQCQQMNEVLQELAKDPSLSNVKFLKNQEVVDQVNGANAPELTKKVQQLVPPGGSMGAQGSKPAQPQTKEDLNGRLKKLVNAAPVMLFMKGTPQEPRCGFSKTIIQLLKEQNVTYSSFNILADPDVRQGLKEYSNWPTFPQMYANGELLGGLDIVKELIESGEFKEQLPTQSSLEDRLKGIINQEKVMVFMKGNPDGPRCGFSKTLVAILAETKVKYGHFDILQDEDVRQGLKTFSNWPTYPQVYVNGDLVGGLDIIKELKESDELESALNG